MVPEHEEQKLFSGYLDLVIQECSQNCNDTPTALVGLTCVWKTMMEETITVTGFMVLPMLNERGEIRSSDMYDT